MPAINEFELLENPLEGVNLIEASAGTGKTYTIAGLYLRLLLEKQLPVDRILVVTFTEAATAELRQIASPTLEEPSLVDLNSVLERAIAASQVVAPRSAISLDKELCPELPGILGWAAELERCFRSIIDNAVEAMAGEGRLLVATRWLGDHNRAQVAIVDHGEGIRPEYLTRVWQPFFTTRKYRAALGLGLSLAYYTVLRHGGEMQVQSTPRRGTAVFITLPANPSAARAEARETGDRGREGAQTAMFAQRFEQSI